MGTSYIVSILLSGQSTRRRLDNAPGPSLKGRKSILSEVEAPVGSPLARGRNCCMARVRTQELSKVHPVGSARRVAYTMGSSYAASLFAEAPTTVFMWRRSAKDDCRAAAGNWQDPSLQQNERVRR